MYDHNTAKNSLSVYGSSLLMQISLGQPEENPSLPFRHKTCNKVASGIYSVDITPPFKWLTLPNSQSTWRSFQLNFFLDLRSQHNDFSSFLASKSRIMQEYNITTEAAVYSQPPSQYVSEDSDGDDKSSWHSQDESRGKR